MPAKLSPTGKRLARYFETKALAKKFCDVAKVDGIRTALKLISKVDEDRLRTVLDHVLEKLGNDPHKIYQAVDYYFKTHENIKEATVTEAAEAFQDWRAKHGGKNGRGVKKSTLDQNRGHLAKFERVFGSRPLVDIMEVEIREFFDQLTNINRRSLYKTLHVFFKWTVRYRYLVINPMANIEPYDEFGVNNEYYSVPLFRRMLRVAAGLEPPREGAEATKEFLPLFAWFTLSGFLGLRSTEAFRSNSKAEAIRWNDLKLSRKKPFVHIREEVAKETPRKKGSDQRWISTSRYLNAARDWLALLPKPEKPDDFIVTWTKSTVQKHKALFTQATGIDFADNALRNSWHSYSLACDGEGGVGRLAIEAGNSEAIAKRHYIQSLEPGTGEEWFSLRPFEVLEPKRVEPKRGLVLRPIQRGFGELRS